MRKSVIAFTGLIAFTPVAGQQTSWRPWEANHMPWSCSLQTVYEEDNEGPIGSVFFSFSRLMDKKLHSETYTENTVWQEFTRNSVKEGELALLLSVATEAFFGDLFAPVQSISLNGQELDFLTQFPEGGHRYFFTKEPLSLEILGEFKEGAKIQFRAVAEDGKDFTFVYPAEASIDFKVSLAQFEACTDVLSHNRSLKGTPDGAP